MATIKPTMIDHVNMTVKDLSASVEFYTSLFGFKVYKDELNSKGELYGKIIGDENIKMCIYDGGEQENLEGKCKINHFGFHVENFAEIEAICKEKGITVEYGGAIDWEEGTSRSIYIKDPDGNHIELSEVKGGGLD